MISVPQADRLLRWLLRSPSARRQADRLYRWYGRYQEGIQSQLATVIPEVMPLPCRPGPGGGDRLNLLIPSVAECHAYGGIATALRLFQHFAPYYPRRRILVTDARVEENEIVAAYRDWRCLVHGEIEGAEADEVIVGCADRRWSIEVDATDHFLATAWWTARLALDLVRWQERQYGLVRRFAYLIQDYEPGFYPWSTRHALAEASYRHPERTIAIFNTRLLYDYFCLHGYRFERSHVFEPRIHPELHRRLPPPSAPIPKRKRILVYGRPGVERNLFLLLIAALKLWAKAYRDAGAWEVVSAGEPHGKIDLGNGIWLVPLGKLTLDHYAALLSECAIGLSMMLSPHPSYPPLEMAAFGVRVLTNRFANKDLSTYHAYIHSVDPPEPERIAERLGELCAQFEASEGCSTPAPFHGIDFIAEEEGFDFLPQLKADVRVQD